MEFHDSLRQIMKQRDLKQADLCRMSGIDTGLMSLYVNGKRSPTLTNAIAMADALQISLDELAGREAPKRVIEQRLLSDFRELSDEGQEVAVNTVYGLRSVYKKHHQARMAETA